MIMKALDIGEWLKTLDPTWPEAVVVVAFFVLIGWIAYLFLRYEK